MLRYPSRRVGLAAVEGSPKTRVFRVHTGIPSRHPTKASHEGGRGTQRNANNGSCESPIQLFVVTCRHGLCVCHMLETLSGRTRHPLLVRDRAIFGSLQNRLASLPDNRLKRRGRVIDCFFLWGGGGRGPGGPRPRGIERRIGVQILDLIARLAVVTQK